MFNWMNLRGKIWIIEKYFEIKMIDVLCVDIVEDNIQKRRKFEKVIQMIEIYLKENKI